jgi:hypothetical protein
MESNTFFDNWTPEIQHQMYNELIVLSNKYKIPKKDLGKYVLRVLRDGPDEIKKIEVTRYKYNPQTQRAEPVKEETKSFEKNMRKQTDGFLKYQQEKRTEESQAKSEEELAPKVKEDEEKTNEMKKEFENIVNKQHHMVRKNIWGNWWIEQYKFVVDKDSNTVIGKQDTSKVSSVVTTLSPEDMEICEKEDIKYDKELNKICKDYIKNNATLNKWGNFWIDGREVVDEKQLCIYGIQDTSCDINRIIFLSPKDIETYNRIGLTYDMDLLIEKLKSNKFPISIKIGDNCYSRFYKFYKNDVCPYDKEQCEGCQACTFNIDQIKEIYVEWYIKNE